MLRPRYIWLVVLALVLSVPVAISAEDAGFKVIINPKNPMTTIDRELLRNMFLKKRVVWNGGDTIRPVDLSTKFSVRDHFTRRVLKKTPAQLKSYWAQQIFSGKGVPPPEVDSATDVINYVLANPGAIGYVPIDADLRNAKVIEVK